MERLKYFKQFSDISLLDYKLFMDQLKSKTFKKNEHLTIPGQIQKRLYLVKSGVQMSYFEAERKTHVIAFTYHFNLCAIPESFFFQTPSKYYLTCLADSEMDYIEFDELQNLFEQSQPLERLFRKISEAVLSGLINRHIELHSLTIEERFKTFCTRSPHLLQLVPHKFIASYLGIDATNFSKLYNNIKI